MLQIPLLIEQGEGSTREKTLQDYLEATVSQLGTVLEHSSGKMVGATGRGRLRSADNGVPGRKRDCTSLQPDHGISICVVAVLRRMRLHAKTVEL